MTRRLLFFFSLIAFAAPQFISHIAPQQPQGFGTIRGTIVRDGTTEPIPDVPVSITGRGGMTAQEAQALLTAVARGGPLGANVPAEILQNAQEAARGGQSLSAVSDREGQYTLTNVPAGPQTVRAQWEGYFMPMANGTYQPSVTQQVKVTAGQTTNIRISMVAGGTITGRVLDPAGKPISEAPVQVPQQGYEFNQIRQYAAPIADDGAFTIPQIPEGRYRFQVMLNAPASVARGAAQQAAATTQAPPAPALPAGAYLADIRQGATSVYDNGLVVGAGNEVNPVEVLLGTSAGSLEGDVLGSDQKPVAAMTVVLVPPDNRRQNAALYKTGRSNEQGHFTLPNVPPGRYTLYAWESVPIGAYQNAQFMERYAARGVSVIIQAGLRTTANVNVIRE